MPVITPAIDFDALKAGVLKTVSVQRLTAEDHRLAYDIVKAYWDAFNLPTGRRKCSMCSKELARE